MTENDILELTPQQRIQAAADAADMAVKRNRRLYPEMYASPPTSPPAPIQQERGEGSGTSPYDYIIQSLPKPTAPDPQGQMWQRNAASIGEGLKSLAEIYGQYRGAHLRERKPEENDKAEKYIQYVNQKFDADNKDYQNAVMRLKMAGEQARQAAAEAEKARIERENAAEAARKFTAEQNEIKTKAAADKAAAEQKFRAEQNDKKIAGNLKAAVIRAAGGGGKSGKTYTFSIAANAADNSKDIRTDKVTGARFRDTEFTQSDIDDVVYKVEGSPDYEHFFYKETKQAKDNLGRPMYDSNKNPVMEKVRVTSIPESVKIQIAKKYYTDLYNEQFKQTPLGTVRTGTTTTSTNSLGNAR